MVDLHIIKINNVYMKFNGDRGLLETIKQKYVFDSPNYKFDNRYQNGVWDGKIRLMKRNKMYIGLLSNCLDFLKQFNINITYEGFEEDIYNIHPDITKEYIENNQKKYSVSPFDYQLKGVQIGLFKKRAVIISPTASGKSFILFMYIQYLLDKVLLKTDKILLTVPSTSLVYQMQKDFIEYDLTKTIKDKIHIILGGHEKINKDKQIYISTWQSLYTQETEYFHPFKVLIFDEVHGAKPSTKKETGSLQYIAESCINAEWRLGVTGTLTEWKTHQYVVKGLFGNIYRLEKISSLIQKNILSDLKIINIKLKYDEIDREVIYYTNYKKEIDFIISNKKRNTFIAKLAGTRDKNTLVLFHRKSMGTDIYKKLLKKYGNKKRIHYIDKDTKTEVREDIRSMCEQDNINIMVASVQVFGTGINIRNLNYIILGHPGKGRVRLLQSIGRGLRKHKNKTICHIYDIIDDLTFTGPKGKRYNYCMNHHFKRKKIYEKENFNVIEKQIDF